MEEAIKTSASINVQDLSHDLRPFLVVYKDGRVQRFFGNHRVPPSTDMVTGVESLDAVVSPKQEGGVMVRLYKPKLGDVGRLPVVIYIHGGGFILESTASPFYHNYLNGLCCKANVLVVSVDYRLAPEHPLPAAYEDSWAAINWVCNAGHPWIKDHADLSLVFFAGDSAGANICHHMAKRFGRERVDKLRLKGAILVHPYFWGKDRIGSELEKINDPIGGVVDKLWTFLCPGTSGSDDPLINPAADPDLADFAAEKVVVYVAELDRLRDRGFLYKELLDKSGCKANVEVVETLGENHVFHLFNPGSPNVCPFMDHVVAFLNSA